MSAVMPPEASATGGQPFLPTKSQMGGELAEHPQSEIPTAQDETEVSPEEQDEYDDFVTRAKLFINDPRKPLNSKGNPVPNAKAPRDVILDHLNLPGENAADSVGRTTAQVAWLLYMNGKSQGHPYSPDVLYHGADEIMSDLYQIATAANLIKDAPAPDSPEEEHLLGLAKLAACKHFGQNLIDSGQANSSEAQEYYLAQIDREGKSGELDKWDPSTTFTPAQLQDFMRRSAEGDVQAKGRPMPRTPADFAALGHPQVVPPGGPPAPPPDAAAPPPPDAATAPPPGGM
jgi:hypothetical protein